MLAIFSIAPGVILWRTASSLDRLMRSEREIDLLDALAKTRLYFILVAFVSLGMAAWTFLAGVAVVMFPNAMKM